MKYIWLLILTGCAGNPGSNSLSTTQSGRIWTNINRTYELLNLVIGPDYGTLVIHGAMCKPTPQCSWIGTPSVYQCNPGIAVNSIAGTIMISGETYEGGGSGDPGCSSVIGNYTFTETATTLTICDSTNVCETYE